MENIWATKTLSYKQTFSINLTAIEHRHDIIEDSIDIVALHGNVTFDKDTKQLKFKPNPFFVTDKVYIQLEFLNIEYKTYIIKFNVTETERPREILDIIKKNSGTIPDDLVDEIDNLGLTKIISEIDFSTETNNDTNDTSDNNSSTDDSNENDATVPIPPFIYIPPVNNNIPLLYKEALAVYPKFEVNDDTFWEKVIHNYKLAIFNRISETFSNVPKAHEIFFDDFIITRPNTKIMNVDFSDRFLEIMKKMYPEAL